MASLTEQNNFIAEIAPIISKYAKQYGYHVASTTIAQACVESNYGNNWSRRHNNYFGIKYGSWVKRTTIAGKVGVIKANTSEEYKAGQITSIIDGFCTCPDMETGVVLYYEFLRVNPRYKNLTQATTAGAFAQSLKDDGYATSSTYVQTLTACVARLNLTRYDNWTTQSNNSATATMADTVVLKIHSRGQAVKDMQTMLIKCGYSCGSSGADGVFGVGTYAALTAFQKASGLAADGIYGPMSKAALQTAYNARTQHKSVDTIAREVRAGKWGNGQERIDRLERAGYDPVQIQHRVNELAKGG